MGIKRHLDNAQAQAVEGAGAGVPAGCCYVYQTEEGTAASLVRLVDGLTEIFEVDVLQAAQAGSQHGAHHQDEEGGEELLRGQRLAGFPLFFLRVAGPRHPEPPESLQVTWWIYFSFRNISKFLKTRYWTD